jgi:hypothetical protein
MVFYFRILHTFTLCVVYYCFIYGLSYTLLKLFSATLSTKLWSLQSTITTDSHRQIKPVKPPSGFIKMFIQQKVVLSTLKYNRLNMSQYI